MQQLGWGSNPSDCIWYDTHQHTIFVKTCGLHAFFSPSFLVSLLLSTPPPSPASPSSLLLPWILYLKHHNKTHCDRPKLLLFCFVFSFSFINEIPQVDVCEHRWIYKLGQMCPILLWNVVACSRNRRGKTQEEDKSNDIGSSRETLSRYGWGQLPLKNTKELAEVARTLTGLKQALVFQLGWLLLQTFRATD